METENSSKLRFLYSRVLIGFALYATRFVLAFGVIDSAVAGDDAATTLNASVSEQATGGTWTATGNLHSAPRAEHTATLLPNGQVLVTGGTPCGDRIGDCPPGPRGSAELYDPITRTWTETGSFAIARWYHTATLLPSGQVLVAGGLAGNPQNPGESQTSAQLYDPATGMWTPTGSMSVAHSHHTATLLPSGQVLVAGGYSGSNALSAELYDPATGVWTPTGSLPVGRWDHTATLLPNGQVLVAGGLGTDGVTHLTSAELYDPSTGSWRETGSMATERSLHTATLLPNGQVLVAGGGTFPGGILRSAELYTPAP